MCLHALIQSCLLQAQLCLNKKTKETESQDPTPQPPSCVPCESGLFVLSSSSEGTEFPGGGPSIAFGPRAWDLLSAQVGRGLSEKLWMLPA